MPAQLQKWLHLVDLVCTRVERKVKYVMVHLKGQSVDVYCHMQVRLAQTLPLTYQ